MDRKPLRLGPLLALAVILLAGGQASSQEPAAVQVNAEAVNEAIDKAKVFLYSKQSADGTWELSGAPKPVESEESRSEAANSEQVGQWGGRTALVVYALLAAGEDVKEPKLEKAIAFLKTSELTGTYAVGLRLLAMAQLPFGDDVRKVVEKDADLLLRSVKTEGDAAGHYDYNVAIRESPSIFSHSRSQYGVLGMWAAARMGYRVDPRYWQLVDAGWRRNQRPTGGWSYNAANSGSMAEETPGMTAAGVASLMITSDYLLAEAAAGCNGNVVDADIDEGLAWLAENFSKLDPDERFRASRTYMTLYNIERLSVAGGLRYVGDHDWYARGAQWLLREQRKDGAWRADVDVIDTAFGLLFLGRGRAPLIAAKLAHESVDPRGRERKPDWNQRPRDLGNLAEFTGKGLERELHWQIVNPDRPVEEWLDAPILYLSGSTALNLDDELKARLKRYSDMGGLLVFNADCGKSAFSGSVIKLGKELFPDYEFRVIPNDHPIYNMQYPLGKGRRVPRMQGLSNGARELMILVPSNDIGRDWQTRKEETSYELGANLYLYAVDRTHMRYKGDRYTIEKDLAQRPNRAATVGRVRYGGNWNPEPGGWDRLAAVLHNEYDVTLSVSEADPQEGAETLAKFQVLHLTGTADFELNADARAAIATYVENGGTLLVDAAGGSTTFAAAADRELRAIFEDAADAFAQPLPAGHELFADKDGIPPLKIDYRIDAIQEMGAGREPRLRGIERDGRLAVIYSPQDLSVGLVGNAVAGVIGYAPETSTALVARVIRKAAE